MIRNLFRNKYPYTDFHELNLSWILDTVTTMEETVKRLEERMTAAEARITAAEARITTAEGKITTLESSVSAIGDRLSDAEQDIDELQTAVAGIDGRDLLNDELLDQAGPVSAGAASVVMSFGAAQYQAGEKTGSRTVPLTIPARTRSAAGVMLPGDEWKLAQMTADDDGVVTFLGDGVNVPAPSGGSSAVTKDYVDSLAITGSATPTVTADTVDSWSAPSFYSPASGHISDIAFGSVHELSLGFSGRVQTAIPTGTTICTGTNKAANRYRRTDLLDFPIEVIDNDTEEIYKGSAAYMQSQNRWTLYNRSGKTIPAFAEISINFVHPTNPMFIDY